MGRRGFRRPKRERGAHYARTARDIVVHDAAGRNFDIVPDGDRTVDPGMIGYIDAITQDGNLIESLFFTVSRVNAAYS